MVIVPSYTDNQNLRGRNQQGRSGEFNTAGQSLAAGMQRLSQGMGSVAEAIDFRDTLKAEADARTAANLYREQLRSNLYDPQTGYLSQTGADAINGQRGNAFESLAAARAQIEGTLSPRARRAFAELADGLDNSAKDTSIRYEADQFRNYTVSAIDASAQGYLDDALRNSNRDDLFNENIAKAEQEIRRAAALQGTAPEVLQQQLDQLQSAGQAGRVIALAQQSPIEAYVYLEANRESISPEDYNKLHDGLEPAYWQARASNLVDSHGGTGSPAGANTPVGDRIVYNNENAVRNQRLSRPLEGALNKVLNNLGLGFEVVSGGQDGQGEGNRRTGSTRHDHGNAADGYFTMNGRRLDWNNPADQAIIADAVTGLRAEGLTGFGAGEGYMDPGMVHLGYGAEGTWGKDGASANAPQWLIDATNGVPVGTGGADIPRSNNGMTLTEAVQISDPRLREATIREIELRRNAAANDRAARRSDALEQGWSILDNGGRPDQIPPHLQAEIGLQGMNDMYNVYERNQTGVDFTDEVRHLELIDMATKSPSDFVNLDLNEDRPNLSRGDLLSLKSLQEEIRNNQAEAAAGRSVGAIYRDEDYRQAATDARIQFQAATGIDPGKAGATQEQLASFNRFTQQLRSGMNQFAETNGRAMTFEERTNLVTALLAPVAFSSTDPGVMDGVSALFGGGTTSGRMFDIPSMQPGTKAELTYGAGDIPGADVVRITEALTKSFGRRPSSDEIVEQYENEVMLSVGVSPYLEIGDIPEDVRYEMYRQFPDASPEEMVEIYRELVLRSASTVLQGTDK